MPLHRARLRISDYTERRKNRLKHQERRIRMVSLSLTSMVDMFAILVIFLLVSSSTVSHWIEVSHNIELPKSKLVESPKKAATVQVSSDGVFAEDQAGGEKLLLDKKSFGGSGEISKLKDYLNHFDKAHGYINIVAHTKVPFGIVKRVITTCQASGFHDVNLAVQPRGH